MSRTIERGWKIWVDTGGTFTDCLAVDDTGGFHREKVLSSGALRGLIQEVVGARQVRIRTTWRVPSDFVRGFQFCILDSHHPPLVVEQYDHAQSLIVVDGSIPTGTKKGDAFEVRSPEEVPVLAARLVTGRGSGSTLPGLAMRLASTRGTNALLERQGGTVALFITQGFGDLIRIGNQQRPDLFALNIQKPEPLYETVIEVRERIVASGDVHVPLELDSLDADISRLVDNGIRCAAVAFMHSYLNPKHELELAEYLRRRGFEHVSCSSELAPFIKILPRSETAVVDAYLAPVIDDYLEGVQRQLESRRLHVMTSAGGMVQARAYYAKDSLLSGPAGGVVGAVGAGRRSGFSRVITFDMGGTSTDVARFDGDYDYVFEHRVGDAHLVAPALAIESVASGGGSICSFDGVEIRVGPDSAGASPGPACYGAGGPLTLTDVNLLLGRLDPSRFEIPVSSHPANKEFEELHRAITQDKNEPIERERLLEGLRDIANERMADAIRKISIRQGYDPREYALVAFGGAGGQHACAVAEHLGMDTIVIPQDASLLSAMGLGHAVIERFAERQVLKKLESVAADIPEWIDALSLEAATSLEEEGVAKDQIEIRRCVVNMRLVGQDSSVQIDFDGVSPLEETFETTYKTIFGYYPANRPIEIESIRVVASSRGEDYTTASAGGLRPSGLSNNEPDDGGPGPGRTADESTTVTAWFDGQWRAAPVFERADLWPGWRSSGPALIFERYSVTVVESGWEAELDGELAIVLRRAGPVEPAASSGRPEIIRLELFSSRFETIAKEMGEMIRRTAISTNVKERMDFSCAVLDAEGELVVNAPHIPVHLGSMGLCVRRVREVLSMEPGDVVVTNDPRYGGSHLPDVTVITPVHTHNRVLLGYVASRAHHAEIGGVQPGSMPPAARRLMEEGVVIPPMHLFKKGRARWDAIRGLLAEGPFPSRAVEINLADLRAAVAANRNGAGALVKLAEENGEETVKNYMAALKKRAAAKMRATLQKIPDGTYDAVEELDDGSVLRVKVDIIGDRACIDFTGTAGVHPQNLNATPAIATSVVIYVLRLLVNEPLPLNEGLMHAITVRIPRGILNPPFPDDPSQAPAIVGGNVETSQRLVDCLLKALRLSACSQGTMNNVTFGTDRYSYYETVCGGAGAGPNFEGASAVHTHMTNTRITDPEILEQRYPVRLERFAIRRGSGGDGAHRGGDGVVREIRFLEPMKLAVLGQHRTRGPYGLNGGSDGAPATSRVIRANGNTLELGSNDGCDMAPGDRFVLETPGGGGYGKKTAKGDE